MTSGAQRDIWGRDVTIGAIMPNVTYGAAYKDTTARKDTIVKIDPAYKGDIWGHKKARETSDDAQKKQTVIQKRLQSVEAIDHLSLTSAELEKVPPSSSASSTTILSSTFPMILTPLSTCLKASSFNYARQALLPELYRELAPGVIYPLLDLDIRPYYLIFS